MVLATFLPTNRLHNFAMTHPEAVLLVHPVVSGILCSLLPPPGPEEDDDFLDRAG